VPGGRFNPFDDPHGRTINAEAAQATGCYAFFRYRKPFSFVPDAAPRPYRRVFDQDARRHGGAPATRMKIVGIQGSPSANSRSGSLLMLAQSRLQSVATSAHLIAVRELPAQALLHAQFEHPLIRQALNEVAQAQVLLIATPIYKAAYSGMLKAFLDLLPENALRGKTVLPLATGGSIAHLLALDYALKPVLSALGARDILDPVFATDAQIARHETVGYSPSPEVVARVDAALQILIDRAEEFERSEEAARERDELLARLLPKPAAPAAWQARDLRWSI
jgi:FMN reductase